MIKQLMLLRYKTGAITANQFGGDKNTNLDYKGAYLASIDATSKIATENTTFGIGI